MNAHMMHSLNFVDTHLVVLYKELNVLHILKLDKL